MGLGAEVSGGQLSSGAVIGQGGPSSGPAGGRDPQSVVSRSGHEQPGYSPGAKGLAGGSVCGLIPGSRGPCEWVLSHTGFCDLEREGSQGAGSRTQRVGFPEAQGSVSVVRTTGYTSRKESGSGSHGPPRTTPKGSDVGVQKTELRVSPGACRGWVLWTQTGKPPSGAPDRAWEEGDCKLGSVPAEREGRRQSTAQPGTGPAVPATGAGLPARGTRVRWAGIESH